MSPCRVLIEGWREHSEVFWGRRGYTDLHAHSRLDVWNQDLGFRKDEVEAAMKKFDIECVVSITLVDP